MKESGLSNAVGKAIAARVQTMTPMASTEMSIRPSVGRLAQNSAHTVDDELQYLCFHPSVNIRIDPASANVYGTLYKVVLVKDEGVGA